MKNLFNDSVKVISKVDRAISELMRNMPVMLKDKDCYLLVSASELLEKENLDNYRKFSKDLYLILSRNRILHIVEAKLKSAFYRISLNESIDVNQISSLLGLKKKIMIDKNFDITNSTLLDEYAIRLVKLANLLPSAVVITLYFQSEDQAQSWCNKNSIILIEKNDLDLYKKKYSLTEVCRSPLFLKNSIKSEIVVYREYNNPLNHYALIIGEPNFKEPTIRIHSSCYTGDLLDSLSCDCRNQLHSAINFMSENAGGIILYLSQDGRGIGLANKIRAYALQIIDNFDTVDANRFLGFEDDERTFLSAINMLNNLNITKLKLLTNNPRKVNELTDSGIKVVEVIPLITEINEHNEKYIKTKVTRLGHIN